MMMRMVNPFTSQRVPLQFSGRVWRRYRMAMLACVLLPIVALVPACGSPSMPLLTSPEPEPEFSPGGNSGNSPVPAEASGLDRPDAIIEFDHLSLQDGLSQSVILDILQDSRGFIWFATQDGLNRFDGYEFKIYKHDPEDPTTLSNNFQWSIEEDDSGNIWVGTNGGGLDRFDRETEIFTHFVPDPKDPGSLSGYVIEDIMVDRGGNLWVAVEGGGLNRFDPVSGAFTHYRHDPSDASTISSDLVHDIFEDQAGYLWIGTADGGINQLDPETGEFIRYLPDPDDPTSLSHQYVCAIAEDRHGQIWVGTNGGGLNRLDPGSGEFEHVRMLPSSVEGLNEDSIMALMVDSQGVMWVGTDGGGLLRYDEDADRFQLLVHNPDKPHSISNNQIYSLYEDQAGIIWAGTFGGGLNKYDPMRRKFLHIAKDPEGLNSDTVWALREDSQGILWIGTGDAGLTRFDRSSGEWEYHLHNEDDPGTISHNTVLDLIVASDDVIWLATFGGGLNSFDKDTGEFTLYNTPPFIMSLLEDQEGQIWFGTNGAGLGRLDPVTNSIKMYTPDSQEPGSISDDSIVKIYEDRDNTIWIGTFAGGLNRFDRETETFKHYLPDPEDPESLSNVTVMSLLEDSRGRYWASTLGGLNLFDPATATFTHYREKDGLPNDFVYGALEDGDGNLWLSTNNGISKFNPETEVFHTFGTDDGLQSTEFNQGAYMVNSRGEMFFGGVNGFNIFHPADVVENAYNAPVVITDFQVFNSAVEPGPDSPLKQSVTETGEIQLTYEDDFFGFEFAALHFSSPARNQYAYILEGLDPDWNYVGSRRFAGYTNVSPGQYTFRVRGSNSDGVWSDDQAFIRIVVEPPFWQTWWFRLLAGVVLIGLGFTVYKLRVRSHETQRKNLEIQVDEKTRELRATLGELQRSKEEAEAANKAKSVFLANMSHELRTPLNAILGFSQLMIRADESGEGRGNHLSAEDHENLEVIVRSGEHLLGLINEVLEMSKIEAGRATLSESVFNLHRMLQGLEDMFGLRAQEKGLDLAIDLASSVPKYITADEGKLRQILMNLLGNAVKFTAEGSVTLRVLQVEGEQGEAAPSGTAPAAGHLVFEIIDTGVGIEPDELQTVFDPFVQASKGAGDQEGTGLGLSISLQYARLMGGNISAESEPGGGSIFRLEVPVRLVADLSAEKGVPRARVVGIQEGQPVYRILIVDDKEVNRQLLVKILEPLAFELKEAVNGKEALEIWDNWEPHLIFMDMRMPVMDGYQATREIRSTTKGQATVIVALTASALEEDRVVILSEGCDAYIRKPFREDELFEALETHLGVRFVFEEMDVEALQGGKGPLAGGRLAGVPLEELVGRMADLPASLRAELKHAVILGDTDKILGVAGHIDGHDPELAKVIKQLARDFNHEAILDLVQEAGV